MKLIEYKDVPKGRVEQQEFRVKMLRSCRNNPAYRSMVKASCKADILFWLNTFGHVHEPRNVELGLNPVMPFNTWPFQDEFLRQLEESFGKQDVCVVKSRCMGASWLIMMLFLHRWQFFPHLAFGVVSREEKLVDGYNKSLFHKVQFCLERQPEWLQPKYDHFHLQFLNHDLGGSIEGATTTGNVFRGDRYSAIMVDEFAAFEPSDSEKAWASTNAATRCRIFNSTPQGQVGAFYRAAHNPAIKRVDLWWHEHPEYRVGLEKTEGPPGFTSPWYAKECKRLDSDAAIASELNLDFGGSGKPYFRPETVQEHARLHARPPFLRGILEYGVEGDDETIRFVERENGWLSLWCYLIDGRADRAQEYGAGADIATGVGATPSVMSVGGKRDREKVAEIATAHHDPKEFARIARMVLWVFRDPYFIWELQGPGVLFGKTLIESGYRNVYYRQDEMGLSQKVQGSLTPGWVPTESNREMALGKYRAALADQTFVNHSQSALGECGLYVYDATGKVSNSLVKTTNADARQNHGDRVIADALCNKALGIEPVVKDEPDAVDADMVIPGHPLYHTQLSRMKRAAAEESEEWEERNPWGSQYPTMQW